MVLGCAVSTDSEASGSLFELLFSRHICIRLLSFFVCLPFSIFEAAVEVEAAAEVAAAMEVMAATEVEAVAVVMATVEVKVVAGKVTDAEKKRGR